MTKQITIVVLCDVDPNIGIGEDLCSASFCYETNGPHKEKVEKALLDDSFGFSSQFEYFKYDLTVSDEDAKRYLDEPDTIDEILSCWKGDE